MGNKKVFIETISQQEVALIINAGFLSKQFEQVAPSAEYHMSGHADSPSNSHDFCFKVGYSREDFMKLAEKGMLTPETIAAFTEADRLVMECDRERAGFWARMADYMRYDYTIRHGHPVIMSSQTIKGMMHTQVCVKRYGVSEYKP